MTLVKDEPLGEESVEPTHFISKQEALGKARDLLIANLAPGSVFNIARN